MATLKERDLLARSLSGDFEARVELFKKFVRDSSHVRKLGSAYRSADDFLHDCFTNVLRTGHSFNVQQSLGDWVESVAAWTALERQRQRETSVPGETGRIRMCASNEGDEAGRRARLASYCPPRTGPEDSPVSRIAAIVGEPQFTLFSKRAIENSSWEDAAAAAEKPVNTVGPIVVRTIDRLARFFGSPPPLNDDLEPVFARIVRDEASENHSDPLKPRGRILSMHLDASFYSATPDMRRIGLSVPAEVRTITLWDAARSSAPPGEELRDHLGQCRYCADQLRALLLLHQALQSGQGVDFLLCPGGITLLNNVDRPTKTVDKHLAECEACRDDLTGLLGGDEPVATARSSTVSHLGGSPRFDWKIGLLAALLLLVGGAFFMQRVFNSSRKVSGTTITPEAPPAPEIVANTRYRDLAQPIPITDARWLPSVLPQNRWIFSLAIDQFQSGHPGDAELTSSGIASQDPGIQMLYSVIRFQTHGPSDSYRELLKAEAMSPRNAFRCWATLQSALFIGDLKTIEQEIGHLSNDPEYGSKAKALQARVKARG